MELKIESMKNMKKAVEKCLDELMKKTDLTPSETRAAIDGFKLYDDLCCRIEECEMEEEFPDKGYSGNEIPYRQYHITSYGIPERAFINRSYGHMSYNPRGWQYEGGLDYNGDPRYSERRHGYSRHSISDRVVSMVEQMMDSAESEYERNELQKYIRAIRAMGMTD